MYDSQEKWNWQITPPPRPSSHYCPLTNHKNPKLSMHSYPHFPNGSPGPILQPIKSYENASSYMRKRETGKSQEKKFTWTSVQSIPLQTRSIFGSLLQRKTSMRVLSIVVQRCRKVIYHSINLSLQPPNAKLRRKAFFKRPVVCKMSVLSSLLIARCSITKN